MKPTLLIIVILFTASLSFGALLLTDIQRSQAAAPDQVTIQTGKVTKTARKQNGTHDFVVVAVAKVTQVTKSDSGLKVGDEVTITYEVPNQKKSPAAGDWAGIVKKNTAYKAYLKKSGDGYAPAAHSGSFEPVP